MMFSDRFFAGYNSAAIHEQLGASRMRMSDIGNAWH